VAVVLLLALLAGLFLVRPGVNRLRARIVRSISSALARPVDVASVKLRLFPQPGFDLEGFVVHDDPSYSAEPMVQAQEVTALLRISSLLRGRIEIARLNLTEPSLNLVRDPQGRWNLEELLEITSRTAVAPTGKARSEKRPGFPYIESDSGRINLKLGAEKTPYTLTDADFAIWQDSENTWGMRLKATPIRSDLNLTDTGILRLEGSWRRAASLRDTPLTFTFLWGQGQMGQVSKLIYGTDKGWRGTITLSGLLSGTPGNLTVQANSSVNDLRRYNVLGGDSLTVEAACSAQFSTAIHALSHLLCNAPMADGGLKLEGSIGSVADQPSYNLAVTADVPMQSLVSVLRHTRSGVPDDLGASGRLNAKLEFVRPENGAAATAEGSGMATEVRLSSATSNLEIPLKNIPLAIVSAGELARISVPTKAPPKRNSPKIGDARLVFGPAAVMLGRSETALVRASVSRDGYSVSLQGDAELSRLLQALRAVGIAQPQVRAEGTANVDMQVAGEWSGGRPQSSGKVKLHAVRARAAGLNQPLSIAAATLSFTSERVEVQDLRASAAGAALTGTLSIPRHCESGECATTFDLHADRVALDQLNALLNPSAPQQPWYRFLSSGPSGSPYLLSVDATGKISAGQFEEKTFTASHVTANVELKSGKLRLSDLRAELWGGKHTGEWKADFTAKPPRYTGSGTVQHVSLKQLAEMMNDGWIAGSADGSYTVAMSGLAAAELFSSAHASLEVNAQDGQLPHLVLAPGAEPLQVRKIAARLVLQEGIFKLEDGQLETPGATYQFGGTGSARDGLDLKLTRNGVPEFNITGTLAQPRVESISAEAQAALKP
jgi:uncharacterized protein involved in outer membrane biogenesis